ncbi:MAG: aminotransferase class V-fold PLP-dependent enzyme [Parachlamydiaceae bacterium]|nr:aminotransferase class V-fold PLP-dependent enzyme [Parachlamydiaceae bacterium]
MQSFRSRIGKVLNTHAENIFFTNSATIGLNQVIRGYINEQENCCLAIDNRSHNSVARPWQFLAGKKCQCIIASIYDHEDRFIESNLLQMLAELPNSPNLLCLTHVSNVNGSVYPVERIIDLVKLCSPSTAILVDASQSAGAVTLSTLSKADFVVFSAHKHLHSLHGAAVLIAKKRLKPIIFGGTGANSMAGETLRENDLFAEVGTLNFPAIMALTDSLEHAESEIVYHRKIEQTLVAEFIKGITQIEGLKIIGRNADAERVGIVALKPQFGSSEMHWEPYLKSQKILIRGGLHCSPFHHQQLGLSQSGTLRFSFGWSSTPEHVEKSISALKEFNSVAGKIFK